MKEIVRQNVLWILLVLTSWAQADTAQDAQVVAIEEARQVMDAFLIAFNARDEQSWADTLHFPHIRVASGNVAISETRDDFLAEMDLDAFAEANDWSHSTWDDIEVIQADASKVHFKVLFSRHNTAGERYVTYRSLYVVQKVEGKWGIRARSSFAP